MDNIVMASFPTEIVSDILSRLPVEPLLRFRCVSKPWCALIDSPDFTKLHLKRSKQTKTNRFLILRDQTQHLYSVSLYPLDLAVEVDHPLQNCNEFGPEVLGSCNGLLLLHDSDTGDVAIWNPSTRRSRKLPSTGTLPLSFDILVAHGLGYDSVNDDYKVVKMTQFSGKGKDNPRCEVEIYSLKSNSWKKIQNFPYCLTYNGYCCGMYASGALHWIVSENGVARHGRSVASVDLATEEYRLLPLPSFEDDKGYMAVVAFEDRLCLMCNYVLHHFDVWVMEEYGVGDSWTKLLSVAQPKHIRSFKSVVPLAFSKDGSRVLLGQDSHKFIWFDLKRNVVEGVKVRGLPQLFHEESCVQSLVPLGRESGSYGKKKKNHREETKEKKPKTTVKKRDGFLSVGFKLKL